MPILPPDVLANMRGVFSTRIHNLQLTLRRKGAPVVSDQNPFFSASSSPDAASSKDYAFLCSFFDVLSGKLGRIFDERTQNELLAEIGLMDGRTAILNYVPGLTIVNIADEDDTITNNLIVGEDEILAQGVWWTVKRLVPDSEGLQTSVILTR